MQCLVELHRCKQHRFVRHTKLNAVRLTNNPHTTEACPEREESVAGDATALQQNRFAHTLADMRSVCASVSPGALYMVQQFTLTPS